jgi:SAM-dependent methyltransferase
MEEFRPPERLIFGSVADVYQQSRPDYPTEAVRWLTGPGRARVLELGAGTGKLTGVLAGLGHQVIATDPSAPMLAELRKAVRDVATLQAAAERIPLASSSVDVVAAATAFHWFEADTALPEIARVLRPDGVLALAWNLRDESVPWVRRLGTLMGHDSLDPTPSDVLAGTGLFAPVEYKRFRFWQPVDRQSLLGLVRSRSYVAAMPEDERAGLLERVAALYDEYGRGHDGMLLPYLTECFRARVTGLANYRRDQEPLTEGLLIDFT